MKGITVTLYDRTEDGRTYLDEPIYIETPVEVENVLIAPMSEKEVLETYDLTGRVAIYQLGIPKGDQHDWKAGKRVDFMGHSFRIVGEPIEGMNHLIPLQWNKKVRVEIYER